MKIGILGAGAYAMAVANVFYNNDCKIKMWSNSEDEVNILLKNRKSNKIDYVIPQEFVITNDMKYVVEESDIIVIVVPSKFVRMVSIELNKYYKKEQIICIASKGIEENTCLFMEDVVEQIIDTNNIAVLSGGTFAEDMVKEVPVGLTLASKNNSVRDILFEKLQNDYVKIETSSDVIGTEICGSVKNVFAIAAGMLEGMNYPVSTKSLFLTEVVHNIKSLIKNLGGKEDTILSFAGIGDILLTCTSTKSRNYTLGKLIGEKNPREEVLNYISNTTVEGLDTLKAIKKLINEKNIKMPIIDLIDDIINGRKEPNELVKILLIQRPLI